jgi:hypothetical protein
VAQNFRLLTEILEQFESDSFERWMTVPRVDEPGETLEVYDIIVAATLVVTGDRLSIRAWMELRV